jgi:transcriptional regulator with XRE-family HTH domain
VLDRSDLAKFDRKAYRDGYLQAKVRGMIAYQMQALREKTGLNQTDFANKIGKTQSVVSRLEDTEYGRVTVQTLLDVACALDVALVVKFTSYPDFLSQTRDASVAALQPATIHESMAETNAPLLGVSAAYSRFLREGEAEQQVASAQGHASNDNQQVVAKSQLYKQDFPFPSLYQATVG